VDCDRSTDNEVAVNSTISAENMQATTNNKSELNPPENTTPSVGTTINGILILMPLSLLIIGLYFGIINP
jgi:hypothetical protein